MAIKDDLTKKVFDSHSGLFGMKYKVEPDSISAVQNTQDTLMLYATWGFFYGLALVAQPDQIWAFGYYETAKMVPGSPDSWGIFSMIGGILIFIGMMVRPKPALCAMGLAFLVVWNFFFAFSFFREYLNDMSIGFQPCITYLVLCLWGITLVSTYRKRNTHAVH
ncbi:hypothetical protein SEA_JUMBO_37 [Gordonia phage Jumbo]|uniref:Uncharacterized protein n=1 Tax=Gordonia phage Jumbo TaxID=1887650 RepID=A0A1B3B0T7_9CAUD|nr:hypothetical protein BIZ69_gp037 [Gordonia phage Jumbo]AOE44548.1 hypothetical protein SEA_JUMBO_37 [Gordonia phage Jumbo]